MSTQLVDSSVYDRAGYLIGKVIRVEPLAEGDFSLVVGLVGDHDAGGEVIIDNSQIHDLDSKEKIIHVDVDYQKFNPDAGSIQLVEERLVVNRKRVKVGEVVVRRVVETEIIEVPIQREKLIIERIGSGEPPVEVSLGETRIQGYDIGAQPAVAADTQDAIANGNFETIQDAIRFLSTAAERSDFNCEKVRVAIILNGDTGLKGTVYDFETPQVAIQKLSRLEKILLNQCSNVRLELFLKDRSKVQAYQDWIAQYALP